MRLATHDSQQVSNRAYERRHEGISDANLAEMEEEAKRAIFNYRKPEVRPERILDLIKRLEAAEKAVGEMRNRTQPAIGLGHKPPES